MRRQRATSSGFTLVELILVLVILTIIVGSIAPSLRGFGVGRTRNDSAGLIVGLAQYARQQAVAEARTYRLNFDPPARAFWITADAGDGTFQAPANDYGKRFEVPDGMTMDVDVPLQPDGQYVQFRASGRTDPAQIKITDRLGGTTQIACSSATEMFAIQPLHPGAAR